jgi:uncharacterized membrane protein YoaK (UPF0700 family)
MKDKRHAIILTFMAGAIIGINLIASSGILYFFRIIFIDMLVLGLMVLVMIDDVEDGMV